MNVKINFLQPNITNLCIICILEVTTNSRLEAFNNGIATASKEAETSYLQSARSGAKRW